MELDLVYKNKARVFSVKEEDGVPILQFPLLDLTGIVRHGISTREGGVSEGFFRSMNLSSARGDKKEHVLENYHRMAKVLGVSVENMVCSDQAHTVNIRVVQKDDAGKGILREKDYCDVDGLVTNIPEICLVTFYADCVPLLFVDPVKRVVGSSHSGWRGTVGKMGRETVKVMTEAFGCCPEDIYVGIGPSICQSCYEVSEDVIEQFRRQFAEKDWEELFYETDHGKYQLNLWAANEKVLLEAGVLSEHIAVSNLCTCCNSEHLFSHRATGGKRGNMAAFIALKEEE